MQLKQKLQLSSGEVKKANEEIEGIKHKLDE